MKRTTIAFACALLSISLLSGCVVDGGGYAPAPYYGGVAPYYGTAYAPTYIGVYGGGYYPHYSYHNIHSGYNNGYWHYQHGRNGASHGGPPHPTGGAPHGGGGYGGGGGHH